MANIAHAVSDIHVWSWIDPKPNFFRLTGWLEQNYGCFSVVENVVLIGIHWKIKHDIFNVVFIQFSFQYKCSFRLLLRQTLYCALQKLHGFLSTAVLIMSFVAVGIKKLLYTASLL